MAKELTKNRLPVRDYQVWTSAMITNGDILDVYGSLGNRIADTVTLESTVGPSEVRFNVAHEIYAEHIVGQASGVLHNRNWVGGGSGALRKSAFKVAEIEDTLKPNVLIDLGTSQTWSKAELGVRDIRVVASSGLRVTVT